MPTVVPRSKRSVLGKLMPPRMGRVFARERLFSLVEAAAKMPGVWVAGPPGVGKTTLVATYLESRRVKTLWMQVDAGDADPATFAHFLDLAIDGAVPRRRTRLPAPTSDDLRDTIGFIRRCFRHLDAALSGDWTLVLDNFQEVDLASAVHAGLVAVLDELPRTAQVIFVSRDVPPGAFARALSTQQLGVIDARSLRFTLDETRALVDLHDHTMVADALQKSTDGWAAAMILIMAARGSIDASATAHDAPAREQLFSLFATEVLTRMPPEDAATLARIAFLPNMTASMAIALSGNDRAGVVLAELTARSLFTDRRSGAEPVYTFHALFGEFLRAHAAATLSGADLQALRLAAAKLLAARGQTDVAITHLMDAAAWTDAAVLLTETAGRFVAQGRTASVVEWIHALPAQQQALPAMRYWSGVCQLASNPARALSELKQAEVGFAARSDNDGLFQTAAAAADAIVSLGERYDTLEPWIDILASHAPAYLAKREVRADVDLDLRILPGLLAAYVHRRTADPLAARLADVAESLLDQPQARSQRILLGSFAIFLLWTGQLDRLDRTMAKIDRMCQSDDTAPSTRLRWYGIGVLIRSLRGLINEALSDAQAAVVVAAGQPAMMAKAHLLMVLAALAARDAGLSRKHLDEATALVAPSSPIDVTTYEFQRSLLALLDGNWILAHRLMRASRESARDCGWPLRENVSLIGLAMTATQTGDFAEAAAALAEAQAQPFYAVCKFHHWIAGLVHADLADQRGDPAECLSALRQAFAVARTYGYDYGPLPYCCGETMSRLCALALTHDIDRQLAADIVRRYTLPAPKSAGEHWPWPIRIRCFGHFAVECDGKAMTQSRKESRKPLDLLKLMIALGGTAVRVDRLSALLWPDMAGDAAQNSFDNAVHRLRKLIGERHIVLQSGALSLNAATCWTDVAELTDCLRQAESLTEASEPALIEQFVATALGLYQGDFLAGDETYAEVITARNRLRAMFVRQLSASGALLEAQDRLESAALVYRRVIEREPLAEDAVRHLMACLHKLGRTAEAREAYRSCRQQLSVVLGIQPAAQTEALAATLC
ncbi:MAG: BTAD domain-containing putative transcriptional regulator [Casimicrobium sp.]